MNVPPTPTPKETSRRSHKLPRGTAASVSPELVRGQCPGVPLPPPVLSERSPLLCAHPAAAPTWAAPGLGRRGSRPAGALLMTKPDGAWGHRQVPPKAGRDTELCRATRSGSSTAHPDVHTTCWRGDVSRRLRTSTKPCTVPGTLRAIVLEAAHGRRHHHSPHFTEGQTEAQGV